MINISLNDEAYARLKSVKKKDQSFSKLILEKIPQDINFDKFFGAWKDEDIEKLKAEVRKGRNKR